MPGMIDILHNLNTYALYSNNELIQYKKVIDVLEKEKHKLTLFSRQKINEVHDFIKFDYPNSIPEFKHFLK
jgi:hypothetical protein